MTNEEILELEEQGMLVIQDVNGNIVNLDDNPELNAMGEGAEDNV